VLFWPNFINHPSRRRTSQAAYGVVSPSLSLALYWLSPSVSLFPFSLFLPATPVDVHLSTIKGQRWAAQ
jgi:hypothetical protein